MPRLGPCARNPDRYRAKAGPVPGAGPEADRDGLRASHPLAPDPGERLVRTLQAAGLIAALAADRDAQYAALEVDEMHVPHVADAISPSVIVLLN